MNTHCFWNIFNSETRKIGSEIRHWKLQQQKQKSEGGRGYKCDAQVNCCLVQSHDSTFKLPNPNNNEPPKRSHLEFLWNSSKKTATFYVTTSMVLQHHQKKHPRPHLTHLLQQKHCKVPGHDGDDGIHDGCIGLLHLCLTEIFTVENQTARRAFWRLRMNQYWSSFITSGGFNPFEKY